MKHGPHTHLHEGEAAERRVLLIRVCDPLNLQEVRDQVSSPAGMLFHFGIFPISMDTTFNPWEF